VRFPRSQGAGDQRGDYHRWRTQYGGLKADDVKRLKELEGENARLKRIVADKELQIQALKELGRGTW
jgi:putative transposase